MPNASEFVVLDGIPRVKVAHALVEQSRTDAAKALQEIEQAFRNAGAEISHLRNADSAPLFVANLLEKLTLRCGAFYDAHTAALLLFEAGSDLLEEDEPPQEEVPSHAS